MEVTVYTEAVLDALEEWVTVQEDVTIEGGEPTATYIVSVPEGELLKFKGRNGKKTEVVHLDGPVTISLGQHPSVAQQVTIVTPNGQMLRDIERAAKQVALDVDRQQRDEKVLTSLGLSAQTARRVVRG